jgi:hypothetical protein
LDDKLDVTYTHDHTRTDQGATTTIETVSAAADPKAPPHSTGAVIVIGSRADLTIPYVFSGTFLFQSGARVPAKHVTGIYTGSNYYDTQVIFAGLDGKGKALFRKPLAAQMRVINKQKLSKGRTRRA